MSITGELREYIKQTCWAMTSKAKWFAIADRIDIEHEKAIRELNNLADAIADSCVQLPKDANGEYIHIGDVMEHVELGYALEVIAVGVDCFIAWNTHLNRYCQYDGKLFRHHHEPSVEDELTDLCEHVWESALLGTTWSDSPVESYIAEYAAKLQLKAQ